jgi:medium-chain acyl-[acyl-carrier-protein] hydrolase
MEALRETQVRIVSYHTDFEWKARMSALYAIFGDEAGWHANALGFGFHDMKAKGLAWVMAKMRVDAQHYPACGDTVTVKTWTKGWDGLFAVRGYRMTDTRGEVLGTGLSHWVLVRLEGMKLVRPRDVQLDYEDGWPEMELPAPRRLPPQGELLRTHDFTVGHSQIDFLHHVNNAKYTDWIADCFDREHHEQYEMQTLEVNYNKQLSWGEKARISVFLYSTDPLTHRFEGVNAESGTSCFFAEAVWRPRQATGL